MIIKIVRIFLHMLHRDFMIITRRLPALIIDNAIIYPITYIISFGYVQSVAYFGNNTTLTTILATGPVVLMLAALTFNFTHHLIFDLEHNRYIDYQLLFLNPRLIVLEKILFSTAMTTALVIPFFFSAFTILHNRLNIQALSIPSLLTIIVLGSLTCSSYHQMVACMIRPFQIETFWIRANHVLLSLGGFWVPLSIMDQWPLLGFAMRLNPFIYISEGIRYSLLRSDEFLSLWIAVPALAIFSTIFIVIAWIFLKKRIDHI